MSDRNIISESFYDRKNPSRYARYSKVITENINGREVRYLSVYDRPIVPEQATQQFHQVNQGDRIDNIAWRQYNSHGLWWVICHANEIFDPNVELEIGTALRIPYMESIR